MCLVYFRTAKLLYEVLEPIQRGLCSKEQEFLQEALFLPNEKCNVNIVFCTFAMKAKSTDFHSDLWL